MISKRLLIILILFSVGCLHALIFGFLEYPTNYFLIDVDYDLKNILSINLYITAVFFSCSSFIFSKKWGIKKVLITGLFLYFLGMILFSFSHHFEKNLLVFVFLLNIGTALFGAAFGSVVVTLTTYIILEMSNHIGIGITILFAFMNLGAMLSPILLNIFTGPKLSWVLTLSIGVLIFLSVWLISMLFFDPPMPQEMKEVKKGTMIWKEMHYRFVFFVLAIILYGFCENTFNLWGKAHLTFWLNAEIANEVLTVFWLFLIIGQVVALVPLHFFTYNKVFYGLAIVMIFSLVMLGLHKTFSGFVIYLALGGLGCSACFPILLAMLEMEIKELTKNYNQDSRMPFMEMGVAIMFGGYLIGLGIIGIRLSFLKMITDSRTVHHFYLATIAAVLLLVITIYLSQSFRRKITSKF